MRTRFRSIVANAAGRSSSSGSRHTSFRWAASATAVAAASALTAATLAASTGCSVPGSDAGPTSVAHKSIEADDLEFEINQQLQNWSGTTNVVASRVYRPRDVAEIQQALASAVKQGLRVRCTGSGLSPNGMGLWQGALISVGHLDKLVDVDKATGCVTVQVCFIL
jgi:xanthine dehydrogenase iron-sulfur cluster and FAD-binding subunit A